MGFGIRSNYLDMNGADNNVNKSVLWMKIPYLPINFKYMIVMLVTFFVGVTGTNLSKFEAFAISFIAYSCALLLDRIEFMATSIGRIIQINE